MGILNEKSIDIESTGVTVSRFNSVEATEQAARQLGRCTQINQLEKGPIETVSQFFRVGAISYLMQQGSKKVESIGEFTGAAVSFLFPIGRLFWINGVNLTTDNGVVVRENAELHACNIACSSAFNVVLPVAYFTTALKALAPGCEELMPGQLLHLHGSEGFTLQLFSDLAFLSAAEPGSNLSIELQGDITAKLAMLVSASLSNKEIPRYHFMERRRILSQAIEYIDANLTGPLALIDLCKKVGVGRRMLERIFCREFQITPHEFVSARRLNLARRKLVDVENRQNISEIAYECGFGHVGRFSGAYRSHFGILPRQERTGSQH